MRRPSQAAFYGLFEVGVTRAGGFHGRIRHNHPDTESEEFAGSFHVFEAWKGTVRGFCALCVWGCSLKSVE